MYGKLSSEMKKKNKKGISHYAISEDRIPSIPVLEHIFQTVFRDIFKTLKSLKAIKRV
jgi:hypothetical protein